MPIFTRRLLGPAAAAALLLTVISAAAAQPGDGVASKAVVDQHLAHGLALYQNGEYEAALIEFRAGFELEARPELLFALAQAERKSGDCASALVYYRRFLATSPPTEQAAAAQLQLERCQAALGSAPADGDPADTTATATPPTLAPADALVDPADFEPASATPERPRSREAPHLDRLGIAFLIGGGACVLAGGGLFVSAAMAANDARDATTYADYAAASDAATLRRNVGIVVSAGGVALLGVAVYRLLRGDGSEEASSAVSVGPTAGGLDVSWAGRF